MQNAMVAPPASRLLPPAPEFKIGGPYGE